jgi:lipoprotein NlpD
MRPALITLLLALLYGCSSTAKAPVSSRGTAPEPAPTVSRPDGAVVTRPAKPVRQPDMRTNSHHTVRPGETLYSIAWQHGLTVGELARQNRIHPPYTIYAGQQLRVSPPARAVAPIRIQPLPEGQAAQPDQARLAVKPAPKPVTSPPPKPAPAPAKKPAKQAPMAAKSPAPASGIYDGSWAWPTRGRVLRGFQPGGAGKKGIDIGGHHAQPVKAAAGGKVVYAGSGLVGYGRLIIVKHNENLLSAYGHNSKLLVAEGDVVDKGDNIAKMGNSGTNRTALYFEIRKDGKPVNPMHYLPRN